MKITVLIVVLVSIMLISTGCLEGPQGEVGPQGEQGPKGDPGGPAGLPCEGCVDTNSIKAGAVTPTKISPSLMKFVALLDDSAGNDKGWDPDGSRTRFTIAETAVVAGGTGPDFVMSVVAINVADNNSAPVCSVWGAVAYAEFRIACASPPANGAGLGYVVFRPIDWVP